MVSCVDRLQVLLEEVSILKSRFKPEDTGHLRTAVNVSGDATISCIVANSENQLSRKDFIS